MLEMNWKSTSTSFKPKEGDLTPSTNPGLKMMGRAGLNVLAHSAQNFEGSYLLF
jgi:hypothetical protein